MEHRFLNPSEGKYYKDGLLGKRILVLGASAYCNLTACPHYDDCAIKQNTINHDRECCCGHMISDTPYYDFDEESNVRSFQRFFELMRQYFKNHYTNELSSYFAYTNYVQHMVGGRYVTLPSDCKEEYLDAFEQTLRELTPDVVIIWGCVVSVPIKNKKTSNDNDKFENTLKDDHYLFQWKNYYGEGKDVTFLNFYHPSSPAFYKEKEWFVMWDYLNKVFKN